MQLLGEFHHADLIFIPVFIGGVRRQRLGNGKAIDIAVEGEQAGGYLIDRWGGRVRGHLLAVREQKAGNRGGT
jgi:hypothetical protein